MTVKKDLKRRIRRRQAATGERYMVAREQVLTPRPPWLVELVEIAAPAAAAGIVCAVRATEELLDHGPPIADVIARLRELIDEPRPELEPLRRAALDGVATPWRDSGTQLSTVARLRDWFAELERGLPRVGMGGRLLAFDPPRIAPGDAVLALAWPRPDRRPLLLLTLHRHDAPRWLDALTPLPGLLSAS